MIMKTLEFNIPSLETIEDAAYKFMTEMGDYTVFAFYGEMGAGKTTFINALCRLLGVETDITSSPSFAIINEYRSDSTAELIDEYLYDPRAYTLVEWPERIEGLLPDDTVRVDITVNPDDNSRIVKMSLPEA